MSRMSAKGYNVRALRDAQLYVVGTALGDGYGQRRFSFALITVVRVG
jgi:hypothetical protein